MDYIKQYKFGSGISPVFIKKILPLTETKKVVDLGCGQGDHLKYFGPKSLGLDISPLNLAEARKKGLRVIRVNMNRPPELKEKFDIVFSSHLIEHLENPIDFLRYIRKLLKPEGCLVLTFPNEYSLMHLKYPYFTPDGNHLYSFSINNMRELFRSLGYKEVAVYRDYFTALSKRMGINPLLNAIDYFPESVKDYLSWSFWFIEKRG